MKKILFFVLIFSSSIFSFPDLNSFDKTKLIWKNPKIFYVHQYLLDVAFGRVNSYLCLINNTDYKNNSNLEDGVGYKVILDNAACENTENSRPWTIVSKQETENSNLDIELSIAGPDDITDYKMKLILEEETSDSNPYGTLTLDYSAVSKGNSLPLYVATYESGKLSENQIKFEAAYYLDAVVLNNLITPGQTKFFYSSKIIHSSNSGGYGTANAFEFSPTLEIPNTNGVKYLDYFAIQYPQYFPQGYTGNYPDGNPVSIQTVNFAYNDKVIKFEVTEGYSGAKNGVWLNAGPNGGGQFQASSQNSELCVGRTGSWTYVGPQNYGVYNTSGDRISNLNSPLTVSYDLQAINNITTNNAIFNGTVKIFSGSWVGTGMQCKKIADGSFYGNTICPGTAIGDVATIVLINGEYYSNFPLFDIPEGTVLTDDQGNEYYIRQLGVKKVYPMKPVGDSDCATLTLQATLDTPDHKFFNYPVINLPKSGAVLVNKFSSNPLADEYLQGKSFSKNGDDDGDGVLNYLDSFPEDALKSLDADQDGVDDAVDNNITPFQPDWTNFKNSGKSLYSNYIKE